LHVLGQAETPGDLAGEVGDPARADLRHALVEEGIRKVDLWTARYRLAPVEFAVEPVDPFFNANRPEDLAEAERLVSLAP
jgi:molybdopterin-guanine dinucleotide biosynthesis protein A